MKSSELRQKFLEFFEKNGHKVVLSSSLLPNDSSVLFTTAGMQQFKPYYLGEKSPYGPNVASVQKCIRTSDIDEVGDERHLTFFEMLGNFSFGGYFKEEAIKYAYDFIFKELGLEIDYVTIFSPEKVPEGDWRKDVPEDKESFKIWQELGVKDIRKEGIDNFWGPTGDEGPCGPTTEIYVNPSADGSGQAVEIWNIVFNEYFCSPAKVFSENLGGQEDKKLTKLETPGVDTGMGLERLTMVVQKAPTVFETDLFKPIIKLIPKEFENRKKRIIADHIRAIAFLISDGVRPSNKNQGYVLRRLIRRLVAYEFINKNNFFYEKLLKECVLQYDKFYPELKWNVVINEFFEEKEKFLKTLQVGIDEYIKIKNLDIHSAFYLYQSFGLPFDILKELDVEKSKSLKQKDFEEELKKHQELSKTSSARMFKGGLADDKPETIKLHTAHHLLLAALQQVFGKQVKQRGSNINSERLRLDFSFDRKLTDDEKNKIDNIVNEKIKEGLDVVKKEMPLEEAKKIGAEMEFGVKYGNIVSVYFIKDKEGNIFSKEFCGGPHVKNTSELGKFKIIREEAVSSGVRRIKATLK